MGIAVGEALLAAARLAVLQEAPLIVVAALGRRPHAGRHPVADADAAHHRSRSTQVKEAGLPYIVVLTDPTTGGVTASFAMLGDVADRRAGRADRLRRRRA